MRKFLYVAVVTICIIGIMMKGENTMAQTTENLGSYAYKVCENGKCGIKIHDTFDGRDEMVTGMIYDDIASISERSKETICKVKSNGKWGFFHLLAQKEATPIKYDDIKSMETFGFYAVQQNGKWAIINDSNFKELSDFSYDSYQEERNHGVKVISNGKYGYISFRNRHVGSCSYII